MEAMSTILVIDTEHGLRELAGLVLERGGYQVIYGNDGYHGLELAYSMCPDAIVVSSRMARLSGDEVCQRVKQDPALAGTPVLLVSDGAPMHDRTYLQQTDADAVLVKPYRPAELLNLVDTLLQETLPN